MTWRHLQSLVPAAGDLPDYQNCLEAFPQLELAKSTPQEFVHHHSTP